MKKVLSMLMAVVMVMGCCSFVAFADNEPTYLDFETSTVPSEIATRQGTVYAAQETVEGSVINHLGLQTDAIAYVNDSKDWVKSYRDIYFQADVMAPENSVFTCLSTQRYGGNCPFVVLNGGKIIIGGNEVASYIPGQWYQMTAILHQSSGTIDCWFDGIKLADNMAVTYSHIKADSTFIAFKTEGGYSFIDNITISFDTSAVPEDSSLKITGSTPADGSNAILSGSSMNVNVTFSTPVDDTSLEGAVTASSGAEVGELTLDESGAVLTIPLSNLKYDTTYTLNFARTIVGANGEAFNKFSTDEITLSFTTQKNSKYNFDNTNGTVPSYMSKREGHDATLNLDSTSGDVTDYSLQLDGRSQTCTYFINDSNMWIGKGNIYYKANVKADDGATFNFVATQRYGGHNAIATFDKGDVKIGGVIVGKYTPGQWYEVMVHIDKSTLVASLWMDGAIVAEDASIAFGHNDVTNSYFAFQVTGGDANVDDIILGDTPDTFEKLALGNLTLSNESGKTDALTSGDLTASLKFVNGSKTDEKATIIAALYTKNGNVYELESVNFESYPVIASDSNVTLKTDITVDDASGRVLKIFLWNSMTDITPVLSSEIILPEA